MNQTPSCSSNSTNALPSLNNVSSLLVSDLVINTLLVILTTTANLCLIGIEIKLWKSRKRISQPKMLILLLAGNDILSSVLGILPKMFIFMQSTKCLCATNVFVYKMARFCSRWFFFLSKLMVVLMGIERCISIRAPFFYIRKCTLKTFCIAEIALAIYSLLFAIVSVYFEYVVFERIVTPENFGHFGCHELFLTFEYSILNHPDAFQTKIPLQTDGFTVLQIVHDLTLVTVLFLCNTGVICGLRDMQRRVHVTRITSCDPENKGSDLVMSTGKEFSRLMMIVIIVFIILITPSVTRELCNQLGVLPSYLADFICNHVALTSTFTNPFLYGLLRRKIRNRIALRLTSCCRGCLPEMLVPTVTSSFSDSRQFVIGRDLPQITVVNGHTGL